MFTVGTNAVYTAHIVVTINICGVQKFTKKIIACSLNRSGSDAWVGVGFSE